MFKFVENEDDTVYGFYVNFTGLGEVKTRHKSILNTRDDFVKEYNNLSE